jgi:thiol:disulfide interchange protein DsbC
MRCFNPIHPEIPMRKLALLLALFAGTALAGEADIRHSIESRFPGTKVTEVGKSALPGIFEVVMVGREGPMLAYTDDKARYVMVGDMLDIKMERNLTRERMDKLTAVKFDSLPLGQAIKTVKGDGKRRLAVFSDIDCPYCKKLESELDKIDNVTIYTFLYPLPMHGDAPRKSKLIWCSKDRAAAWDDYFRHGRLPAGKGDCDTPIEENLALGAKLHIDGTPAMIFANGKRVPGYMPAARLDDMLTASENNR